MKAPTFAPAYVVYFPMLSEIARENGYALAVHGSVVNDFDLVAIPWTNSANAPELLREAFANYACMMYPEHVWRDSGDFGPEQKPHGRIAFKLPMGNGAAIDVSVMPRESGEIASLRAERAEWAQLADDAKGHLEIALGRAERAEAECNRLREENERLIAKSQPAPRASIEFRPLLVSGCLTTSGTICIDSEQPAEQQSVALWHEVLHWLGLDNERVVEALALLIHAAVPGVAAQLRSGP